MKFTDRQPYFLCGGDSENWSHRDSFIELFCDIGMKGALDI